MAQEKKDSNAASSAQDIASAIVPQQHQHPCPSCGHCPTCGRGGQTVHPWYGYTYPAAVPQWWYGGATWTAPNTVGGSYTITSGSNYTA